MKTFAIALIVFLSFTLGFSQIKIDGNFDDWDASMQFDVAPNSVEEAGDYALSDSLDIKDVYVTHDDSMLYIRIDINDDGDVRGLKDIIRDSDGNKPLIQIGLDTDMNKDTGFNFWGSCATGADYYINATDPKGNFELQSKYQYGILDCNTPWPWATVEGDSCQVAYDDIYGTSIEVGIPRAAIGENYGDYESTAIIIWSEDPREWGNVEFVPDNKKEVRNVYRYGQGIGEDTSLPAVPDSGIITIDGNFDDWDASMQFDVAPNAVEEAGDYALSDSLDIKDVYVTHDSANLYIRIDINDDGDVRGLKDILRDSDGNKPLIQIGLDTDMNKDTGFNFWGSCATGADFYINATDPVGNFELQSGYQYGILNCNTEWPWAPVEGDSCKVAYDDIYGTSIEIAIPRAAIGEVAGQYESTAIFIWSEDPREWGNVENVPNDRKEVRNVYNYGRGIGDLTTAMEDDQIIQPVKFSLDQNYPNPFNPTTTIKYSLEKVQHVDISIYNLIGQKVTTLYNGIQSAGSHQVVWNGLNSTGSKVSTGMYFYRIQGEKNTMIKKMILMK